MYNNPDRILCRNIFLSLCVALAACCSAPLHAQEAPFEVFNHHPLRPVAPYTGAEVSADAAKNASLKISAARGEYEMAAFAVKAASDLNGLCVTVGDLKNGIQLIPASGIKVHYVLAEKIKLGPKGNKKWQNLPNWFIPNEKPGIKLAAGQTVSFYLTVHIPLNAPAGRYTCEVSVVSGDYVPKSFPLTVSVLPFTMSQPKVVFCMLYTYEFRYLERWDPAYEPKRKIRPAGTRQAFVDKGKACVQDIANHGMTNIFPHSSRVLLKKEGELNLVDLGMSMKTAVDAGMKKSPGWFVGNLLNAQWKDLKKFDETRDCAFLKEIIIAAGKSAKANRYEKCILVPADEPKVSVPEKLVVARKLLKAGMEAAKANNVRIALTSDYETFKMIPQLYNIAIFAGGTPEQWQEIRQSGHEVWLYDNNSPCGHTPAWSRFVYGFYGWRTGLDGITSWTYPLNIDTWGGRKRVDTNGNAIAEFDSTGRPINTVVWEAIREGVEDRRYIDTLVDAIDSARKQGKTVEADRASQLLVELKNSIPASLKDYGYVHTEYGEPTPGDKFPPEWFDKTRLKIAAAIIRLQSGK